MRLAILIFSSLIAWHLTWAKTVPNFHNNMFGYTSQPQSPTTHQILMGGYRAYTPQTRIFNKQDSDSPFVSRKTANGFDYVAGNPVLFADHTGHIGEEIMEMEIDILDETQIAETESDFSSQPLTPRPRWGWLQRGVTVLDSPSLATQTNTESSPDFIYLSKGTQTQLGTIAEDARVHPIMHDYLFSGNLPEGYRRIGEHNAALPPTNDCAFPHTISIGPDNIIRLNAAENNNLEFENDSNYSSETDLESGDEIEPTSEAGFSVVIGIPRMELAQIVERVSNIDANNSLSTEPE